MNLKQQERQIKLKKAVQYTRINKVYCKKAIIYSDIVELYEYNDLKITFTDKNRIRVNRKKEGKRRDDSIQRTRQNLYRLIASNKNKHGDFMTIFCTLTFKENLLDLSLANYHFKYFIKKLRDFTNVKLKYIFIPEFQKRGAVHYHGVFFNLPFIEKDIFQSIWGKGFTRVESVYKINDISAYVAKYLSKETLDERLFGQRIIMSSRGLIRPFEIFDSYEVDNLLDQVKIKRVIQSHINKKLSYKKIKCQTKIQ